MGVHAGVDAAGCFAVLVGVAGSSRDHGIRRRPPARPRVADADLVRCVRADGQMENCARVAAAVHSITATRGPEWLCRRGALTIRGDAMALRQRTHRTGCTTESRC